MTDSIGKKHRHRQNLYNKQGGKCHFCKEKMLLSFQHLAPHPLNLAVFHKLNRSGNTLRVLCCYSCGQAHNGQLTGIRKPPRTKLFRYNSRATTKNRTSTNLYYRDWSIVDYFLDLSVFIEVIICGKTVRSQKQKGRLELLTELFITLDIIDKEFRPNEDTLRKLRASSGICLQ